VYEVEEGIFFPSVSTICRYGFPMDEFLLKWYIEQSRGDYNRHVRHNGEASEVGTYVHDVAEQLIKGEEITIPDDPMEIVSGRGYYPTFKTSVAVKKAVQSFVIWYNENQPNVISTEEMLFATDTIDKQFKFPFAGRCDMVADIDGELWMLDIKTSKKVENVISMQAQLSMYVMLWNATHERKIDRMGIVWAKKDYRSNKPPRSVMKTYEYKYDEELVRDVYRMFNRFFDGFSFGVPKTKAPLPNHFKLNIREVVHG
jgi:sulfur relay (sulfurtransferase) DsrC/TusE family protein